MNIDFTLFKSLGLVFIFHLAFNLTGNCLDIKSQKNGLADISFFCQLDFLEQQMYDSPDKNPKDLSYAESLKEDKSPKRDSHEKAKKKDKSHSEQKKETALKSYGQLKSVLEEVDMMVSGWI